ncbi:MAG TPA: MaoC family dehydratase [Bacillota bacterium]|jgi:3-hydroxybutyryl-CoA dehydratase|nr:MaoC family dehydratase [Peptococcaceae bacterium MAG4]NLW38162.1 MaoC family dehydratase [Peptococcaceae bacterium]HPZ43005.1 MaoC family dehydratase [Bacillota bacterium]HQD75534.1 MaoC family dehydratase [Bacillota bacterium]HUM57851.1 MaoC family dehydratase [Bacillota bacterium]
MAGGKRINELEIGQKEFVEKTISETDIYLFAGITGDLNPIHVNEEYAKNTFFKGRIAHGILTAGLVSTVIGMKLPGPGTIYMAQELKFTAPVRIGDTIKAEGEVIELNKEENIAVIKTTCTNQDGIVVLTGKATVKPPK